MRVRTLAPGGYSGPGRERRRIHGTCAGSGLRHETFMPRSSTFKVRAIALGALVLILAAFITYYVKARVSERGTSRDDSPAAEIGAERNDR
jgi:hypothetical protein